MSKAILILDEMPMACAECKLNKEDVCVILNKDISHNRDDYGIEYEVYVRDYECPLKELPQFKKPKDPDETWDEMHIRAGYNTCLEELLGGNDEF